jgi:erythromycin esterase-like protein
MVVRRRRLGQTEPPVESQLLAKVRSLSRPLRSLADLDPLLARIGAAHYVLLGEASHGTHEYYTWRTAFLFLKETRALQPLHEVKARKQAEVPETFPSSV